MCSPSSTTTRKRVFGGAWCPSSQVRHRNLVDLLPSHAVDLVLCARMARQFSRLPASQPTILGFVVAYSSRWTRWCAARGRGQLL